MTDVTDRPTDLHRPRGQNRTLMVAVFALAVIVLVVVAVAVVNDRAETGSELPEEAASVLDDYRNAFVNQDVEAFWASITDDFFAREYGYGIGTQILCVKRLERLGPTDLARQLEFDDPQELIEVKEVVVSGDGPWIVTAHEIWEQKELNFRLRWAANMTRVIVEDAGTMKIASSIGVGISTEAEN